MRPGTPRRLTRAAAAVLALAAALALGWYGMQRAGGAGDANELTEEALLRAEAAAANPDAHVYAQLERQVAGHPDDGRALVLKARFDMRAQRYEQAAAGFQRAVSQPKVGRDPGVWVEYAEARGMLQGGTLLGEPEQLVEKALSLDAGHPQALELAGSAAWERRDFGKAAAHWKMLLAQIPEDSPRHAELSLAIDRAQQRAKLSLPPAPEAPR